MFDELAIDQVSTSVTAQQAQTTNHPNLTLKKLRTDFEKILEGKRNTRKPRYRKETAGCGSKCIVAITALINGAVTFLCEGMQHTTKALPLHLSSCRSHI